MIAAGEGWVVQSIDAVMRSHGAAWSEWLHPAELARLTEFNDAGRRRQSACARVLAKRLLLQLPKLASVAPREVRIHSRRRQAGRPPIVEVGGRRLSTSVSLSHGSEWAAAAIGLRPGERVGIDVAELAPERDGALRYWLSDNERTLLERRGGFTPTHLWAAKEAAFKTLPAGAPFAPRRIEIFPSPADAFAMRWRYLHPSRDSRGTVQSFQHQRCLVAVARRRAAAGKRHRENTFA